MAILTIATDVSIDANSTTFAVNGVAASAITAGMACYINASGLVAPCNNTHTFVGFAVKSAAAGRPVTLFRMAKIANYSAAMIPGAKLYQAGAGNEGKLSDAPIVGTDPAVAIVVSTEDIIVA